MIDFLSQPNFQRLAFLAGGLLLGLLAERVFFTQFQRFTKKTEFEWDDVIAHSFKGVLAVWFTAGGAYLALTVGEWDPFVTAVILKILRVLFILPVIVAAMSGVKAVVDAVSKRSQINSPTLVLNLARLAIGILGGFIILQNLDIDITPLITALGIGGLAVALALQDTLGNLFAGVQIILSGQVGLLSDVQRAYRPRVQGGGRWVCDVSNGIPALPSGSLFFRHGSCSAAVGVHIL